MEGAESPAGPVAPTRDSARARRASPLPATRSVPGHVFISYSSDDHAVARALDARLVAEDVPVWLDQRSIPPGSSWDAEIVKGIRASAVVAVLISPKAMASNHVRQELRLAMQYKKLVLPLLLQPTPYPEEVEYVLAGRQWVELRNRTDEQWFADVLAAVQRLR